LIATGTKTLQHQAMESDIPKLRKMLGLNEDELIVRPLVGSSNHLCELMFHSLAQEDDLLREKTFVDSFTRFYFEMIFFYNSRLPQRAQILRGAIHYVLKRKNHDFAIFEKDLAVDLCVR